MVNKPRPKNYANFRSYANAVRAWYLNKPLNTTNTLKIFTNALENFFRERGGPSTQQNMIAREVENLYKTHNLLQKKWFEPNKPHNFYRKESKLRSKLAKHLFVTNNVNTNLKKIKNTVRRRTMDEIAAGQFMKAFGNSKYNTIRNVLLKKLRTAWTNTGKTTLNRKVLRKPNTGNTVYFKNNKWVPYVPENLTTFRNTNGSIWVFYEGKWHKVNTTK